MMHLSPITNLRNGPGFNYINPGKIVGDFKFKNHKGKNSKMCEKMKILESISLNNDSSLRILSKPNNISGVFKFSKDQVKSDISNGNNHGIVSKNNSFIKEIENISLMDDLETINECDETQNSICFSKCSRIYKSYSEIIEDDSILRDDSFVRTLYDTMDISAMSHNSLNSTTVFNEIVMDIVSISVLNDT